MQQSGALKEKRKPGERPLRVKDVRNYAPEDSNSEKDTDINAVMTAFQMYIYPKMPISNYSASDKRINAGDLTIKPIDGKN